MAPHRHYAWLKPAIRPLRPWWTYLTWKSIKKQIRQFRCKHYISLSHWGYGRDGTLHVYCPHCGKVTHHVDVGAMPKDKAQKILTVLKVLRDGRLK